MLVFINLSPSPLYNQVLYKDYLRLIELGIEKFPRSTTSILFKMKTDIKRQHHYTKNYTLNQKLALNLTYFHYQNTFELRPTTTYATNNSPV